MCTVLVKEVVNSYGWGWNKGCVKYFENLRGATKLLIRGTTCTKTFWVILPQICVSILCHDCTLCGAWNCSRVQQWAAKIVWAVDGGHEYVCHHGTFQPAPVPPTPSHNFWLLPHSLCLLQVIGILPYNYLLQTVPTFVNMLSYDPPPPQTQWYSVPTQVVLLSRLITPVPINHRPHSWSDHVQYYMQFVNWQKKNQWCEHSTPPTTSQKMLFIDNIVLISHHKIRHIIWTANFSL